MKSVRVVYGGCVQGVGFRWTVKRLACGFEVSGTVRNLPDGRVELVAQGDEVDGLLRAIRMSSLAGHIDDEEIAETPRRADLRGFSIIP